MARGPTRKSLGTDSGRSEHRTASNGRWTRLAGALLVAIMAATMPAAAMVDQLGTDIGSSGGGGIMMLVWFVAFAVILGKGAARTYRAVDHMGSIKDEKRRQGREEIVPALGTVAFGLVGIPAIATFIARIFPDSWSWLGVDIGSYVNIPGTGGGGDTGSGSVSTMIDPEWTQTVAEHTLNATDIVVALV